MNAKKSFGQHFLRDGAVVQSILNAAAPEEFSLTVEVGPGQGALTASLAGRAKALMLIEADRDLIPSLSARFPDAQIIQGDAAQVPLPTPHEPWLLVGNLPYNAANAIIMHALEAPTPPARMVVMVQKEVGERLLGSPGSRGLLTVAVQLYADVERICTVKPGAFVPPPKVDSMVVKITPQNSPPPGGGVGGGGSNALAPTTSDSSLERRRCANVIRLAKAGFANRRKQLHGNLAEAGIAPSERTKQALTTLGLPPTARAEELSIAQWRTLSEQLASRLS